MSKLICESHVKEFILLKAKRLRPGWDCKQISQSDDYVGNQETSNKRQDFQRGAMSIKTGGAEDSE